MDDGLPLSDADADADAEMLSILDDCEDKTFEVSDNEADPLGNSECSEMDEEEMSNVDVALDDTDNDSTKELDDSITETERLETSEDGTLDETTDVELAIMLIRDPEAAPAGSIVRSSTSIPPPACRFLFLGPEVAGQSTTNLIVGFRSVPEV